MWNTISTAFAPRLPASAARALQVSEDDCYRWGMERLSAERLGHALLLGATQAGKSVLQTIAMQDLLPQVASRPNTRGFAYDPKGDMHAILSAHQYGFTDEVINTNPLLKRGRSYAIHRDIKSPKHAYEFAAGMVQKERSKEGAESFFTITLKDVVKAVMCAFLWSGVPWTLRDLLIALTNDKALSALLLPHFETERTYRLAFHQREETAMDIRSSINNFFNRFASVAALWHAAEANGSFSIDEWSKSNQILVLPGTSGDGDPIQVITQVLFDQLAIQIVTGPEAKHCDPAPRIFGFFDELRLAGYLKRLKDLLFLSASKGLRLYLAAQGIEGLRAVFGTDEAYEIASLCANKGFLVTHGSETADFESRQMGKQLVMEAEYSINLGTDNHTRSKTMRWVSRDLVEAIRFMQLGTPQHGGHIEGYFIAPELRSEGRSLYWRRVSNEKLFAPDGGALWQPSSFADLEQRDAVHQKLQPWSAADCKRLKLPLAVLADQAQASRFTSISSDLFR